jgi:hypothetical protein
MFGWIIQRKGASGIRGCADENDHHLQIKHVSLTINKIIFFSLFLFFSFLSFFFSFKGVGWG